MYKKLIEHHIMSAYFDLDHPSKFGWACGHVSVAQWLISMRWSKTHITFEDYTKQTRSHGITNMNLENFEKSIEDAV